MRKQTRIGHPCAEDKADRHIVVWAEVNRNRVTRANRAWRDDPQIGARLLSAAESLDPVGQLKKCRKRATRGSGRGHLEHEAVTAYQPAFTDSRPGDIDARHGEVLAEHSVDKLSVQVDLPLVEVFARIDVDSLIVATVKLLVADGVADETTAGTGAHRPRRA